MDEGKVTSAGREPSRAEGIFLAYLKRVEAGEDADFEQLCVEHAEVADELRELHEGAAWARSVGLEGRTLSTGRARKEAVEDAQEDPWVGELFHGKYRMVRRIGRGGFGTVYEAIDERGAGNRVAIKVLSDAVAASAVHQQSFRDEARRATRLSHPNVVDWKGFDQTDEGVSYFVMELVQGDKFDQVLKREGRIEPDRTARLLLQIVDALRAAHHLSETESVLHLDLKPDNLFLVPAQHDREEQIKVIDFGIGQYIGDQEVHGDDEAATPVPHAPDVGPSTLTFLPSGDRPRSSKVRRSRGCTPEYASPEQVDHVMDRPEIVALDGRSDLYSLGVIAFQMLTGRLPFESSFNRLDILRMHRSVPAPKVGSLGVRVPKRLARFVDRCLEKDRDLRWPETRAAYAFLHDIVHPPEWKAVAKVTVPLLLAGTALGSWAIAIRDAPIPVAGLRTEDGRDLSAEPLHLGPEHAEATLRLTLPGGQLPEPTGAWGVLRDEDGTSLPGWSASWVEGGSVAIAAPRETAGRVEQRVRLALDRDRLHAIPFTAIWIGEGTWEVQAMEVSGRPVEELLGAAVDPLGAALDVWIAGPSRNDVSTVRARVEGGEDLAPGFKTGIDQRDRYRLALADLGLSSGTNSVLLRVSDASGAEWARELTLDVVGDPLRILAAALVDAAGTRGTEGDLPRCNRTAGRFLIAPRTRATLAVRLSRAADASWSVLLDDSPQPVLRGTSTGRQEFESALADLARLRGGEPYEGRLRIVASEDAYVIHAPGSDRGHAEVELAFRYENTEPRFTAQWIAADEVRDLGEEPAFTNRAEGTVLVTRQEPVPIKLSLTWWPVERPDAVQRVESVELRNLQTHQARLPLELEADGRYQLQLAAHRYDTSTDATSESPDLERSVVLVLDRSAPTAVLGGLKDGEIVRARAPTELLVRFEGSRAGDAELDLRWTLARVGTGEEWSGALSVHDPAQSASIDLDAPWSDAAGDADGWYRLELSGRDRAGNVLAPSAVEFEVALAGPRLQLEQPSDVGKWHPDAASGLWTVRARAHDANGVAGEATCELLGPELEAPYRVALRAEPGSTTAETVFEGFIALPHTLSGQRVHLRLAAYDRHGAATTSTSPDLELPIIARPRPERIAARLGAHPVGSMRLVRGNAEYAYVFGGRGDAIENPEFVRAGLAPFNDAPRRSRPRSWQIELAPGRVADYYLDEREVTVQQFLAFLRDPGGYDWSVAADPRRRSELLAHLSGMDGDAPVADVTWGEADAYARWVGKRLPSWAEWEFAVRGGGEYRPTSGADDVARHAGLCAGVSEWTGTAFALGATDDVYPHLWARGDPGRLIASAPVDGADYWIVGGSDEDGRRDFTAADHAPPMTHRPMVGFRCAVSLEQIQALLGAAGAPGPTFEELP